MKTTIVLMLLITLFASPIAQERLTATPQDDPSAQNSKMICLFNAKGLPIPVSFEQSLTLSQALEKAEVVRAEVKNKAVILRRASDNSITQLTADLSAIEKGKAPDLRLKEHDLVTLIAKKKQPNPNIQAIGAACVRCGCRIVSGMHGPLIVP